MANLVKLAIQAVVKIKAVVETFAKNNKECDNICDFVETLSADLKLLEQASIMGHPSVSAAMKRLNDTLQSTESKVKKCQNTCALLQLFKADNIAATLDHLRKDISNEMLSAVLVTSTNTNSQVHKLDQKVDSVYQNVDRNYDAICALCLPLHKLVQHLGIDKNKTGPNEIGGDRTGLKKYSRWSDLANATKLSTNDILKDSSSSIIYKVKLDNEPVVIKKFHKMDQQIKARFVLELGLVPKLQHRNIVKLLGYCFEYNESLVLEPNAVRVEEKGAFGFISRYISKQSMVEGIYKENKRVVDWPSVFRIIHGIAKGVRYLHRQCVVHLDLKPENILLDTDMTPKIKNFGKAQQLKAGDSDITLDVKDLPTEGKYVAPELSANSTSTMIGIIRSHISGGYKASTKSDVYSFGVILLETIGLRYAAKKKGNRPTDPGALAEMIKGSEQDLFDGQRIAGAHWTAARWCVIVGLLCCLPDPKSRPSMENVIDMLGSCTREDDDNTNKASSTGSRATGEKNKAGPSRDRAADIPGNDAARDSMVVICECKHRPHWPVSCDTARAWMDKKKSKASLDDRRYQDHYQRWEASHTSAQKAMEDMVELKVSWLQNMADDLGIGVTDLDFLTKAYEEIVECRRVIPWVHAYGHFLDPERDGNKHARFNRLQEEASLSLELLNIFAEEERLKLCAAEVEAITEMYPAFKTKLMDLTGKTRQDFEKLVKAVQTDFQD